MARCLIAWTLILLSAAYVQSSVTDLFKGCPKTYTIPDEDGTRPITMKMKIKPQERCERIRRGRQFKDAVENALLRLNVTVKPVDYGLYVLNIEWDSITKGGFYPKRFLLSLTVTKFESEYEFTEEHLCVSLHLRSNRRAKLNNSEERRTFHMDCIRLLEIPDTYVDVRILSLPGPKALIGGQCRHKRSMRSPKPSCPRAECAKTDQYPLYLGDHKFELCRCYHLTNGDVSLKLTTLDTGHLVLNFSNIPPFTEYFYFRLDADGAKYNTNYTRVLGNQILNGTYVYTTPTVYSSNNYTITVVGPCDRSGVDDRNKDSVESVCGTALYRTFPEEVMIAPVDLQGPGGLRNVLLAVLLGVLVAGVATVTTVVRCVLQRRKSQGLATSLPNNEMIEMSQLHPEQTPLTDDLVTDSTWELTSLHKSWQLKEDCVHLKSNQSRDRAVMLMSHPDTPEHVEAVKSLIHCLEQHDYSVIGQVPECSQNWTAVGEAAGTIYHDIIAVMSQGLCDLCRQYKTMGGNSEPSRTERWNTLLQERNGEYWPCVAIQTLLTNYTQNRTAFGFRMHLVSIIHGNSTDDMGLIDAFISENRLFLNESNTFKYEIHTEDTVDGNAEWPGLSQLLKTLSSATSL